MLYWYVKCEEKGFFFKACVGFMLNHCACLLSTFWEEGSFLCGKGL